MTKSKQQDDSKLDALKNLEAGESPKQLATKIIKEEKPNTLDGYIVLEKNQLPQEGLLYPESWEFAYRAPMAKEVVNFSTVNERDQPAIINLVEDLIRKCVVIYDTDQQKQIDSGNINDSHRTFFLLLLVEAYLPESRMGYDSVCSFCKEPMFVHIHSETLVYKPISEKLLSVFDGRVFKFNMVNCDEPIIIHVPTINFSSKIFRHLVKVFRDNEKGKQHKDDKIVYDKQFLLFAPFLFETGMETIDDLRKKYNRILTDDAKYKAYLEIINNLDLDNQDYVQITHTCQSVEEAEIRFPGGWKKLFTSKENLSEYFN